MKPVETKRLADALHKLKQAEEKEMAAVNAMHRITLTENDQVFVKDGERCWFVKLAEVRLFRKRGELRESFLREQQTPDPEIAQCTGRQAG